MAKFERKGTCEEKEMALKERRTFSFGEIEDVCKLIALREYPDGRFSDDEVALWETIKETLGIRYALTSPIRETKLGVHNSTIEYFRIMDKFKGKTWDDVYKTLPTTEKFIIINNKIKKHIKRGDVDKIKCYCELLKDLPVEDRPTETILLVEEINERFLEIKMN